MYDNEFHRQADILANRNSELTAANKAIVALSEALEELLNPCVTGAELADKRRSALTTHAPAIEKARGG